MRQWHPRYYLVLHFCQNIILLLTEQSAILMCKSSHIYLTPFTRAGCNLYVYTRNIVPLADWSCAADLCEICDDGNVASNDGCSAECRNEDLFRCRDGCSGPLCQAEEHCDEVLIGERMQVFSHRSFVVKLCSLLALIRTY